MPRRSALHRAVQAVAKAIIHGKCGWYYGKKSLSADAIIKAEATIKKWEYITC